MQPSRPVHRISSQRGAALLASLCFATVLAISLGSYMALCTRTLQMSTRNLSSSHSVELAETGMEEALWALNKNDWSNGWAVSGTTATKTLGGFAYENGVNGSVTLTVTNYNGTISGQNRTITATGTTSLPDGTTSTRTITSSSAQTPLFVNAIAATTSTVSFSSAGTVDSYDSSLGTYASQTPTYSAVVSSGKTATSSATVTIVNAQIKGYVASLYTGGPSYSSSAKLIGSTAAIPAAYQGASNVWIDTRRISTSPYQPVFDINTISGGTTLSAPANNSTTTLGNPSDTSPAVYRYNGLNLIGTTKIVIDGPVRLIINGNFYIGLNGGTPSIDLTANGSLEVFTNSDIAIYGKGMNNPTLDPSKLAVYGTNSLTAPDMNTTVAFYGVIYTPSGNFKVISNTPIYGGIIAKQVSFTGSAPVFHYDLNLRNAVFSGLDTPFSVSGWRETTGQ